MAKRPQGVAKADRARTDRAGGGAEVFSIGHVDERKERLIPMILAIDPGNTHSAWVALADDGTLKTGTLVDFGKVENMEMLNHCRGVLPGTTVVIEKIASYGMAVGAEVFETVFWSGRFAEAAEAEGATICRIPRLEVKLQICRDSRAKDANIRQALIDRWGGIQQTKKGGALHGVSKDVWAALAVGVTYIEKKRLYEAEGAL